jgi:hypothetical protein
MDRKGIAFIAACIAGMLGLKYGLDLIWPTPPPGSRPVAAAVSGTNSPNSAAATNLLPGTAINPSAAASTSAVAGASPVASPAPFVNVTPSFQSAEATEVLGQRKLRRSQSQPSRRAPQHEWQRRRPVLDGRSKRRILLRAAARPRRTRRRRPRTMMIRRRRRKMTMRMTMMMMTTTRQRWRRLPLPRRASTTCAFARTSTPRAMHKESGGAFPRVAAT